jgi:CysZ protein
VFASIASQIAETINEKLSINDIPDTGAWLSFAKPFLTGYFSIIIAWILKLIFIVISSTFSRYLILIFLSPLFALLSESIEEKTTGKKHAFHFTQLVKDIFRGIGISLRNMLFEYFIMAVSFVVTIFFPPLIVVTAPLLLFISWYFIGFTMLDYNFERHKMSISQSIHFARKNKGTACGIGAMYYFLMLLPSFIGMMFAPVIAVVGATMCFLQIKNETISIKY